VTWQAASPGLVSASVHDPPPENPPVPSEPKLTDPVGVDLVPASVSETVAVHVVPRSTVTEEGTQDTDVADERLVTVTVSSPLLVAWVLSPE